MLTITIPGAEYYDESTGKFFISDETVLCLEHSLLSLSKWESKYQTPFLSAGTKTSEQVLGYIEAMNLSPEFSPEVFSRLTQANLDAINAYIESKESATTFGIMPERKGRGEVITAELIYYWMVAFTIPFECENWHLNRLFALVRICNVKNSKQPKRSKSEIAAQNRELNAKRRAQMGTSG